MILIAFTLPCITNSATFLLQRVSHSGIGKLVLLMLVQGGTCNEAVSWMIGLEACVAKTDRQGRCVRSAHEYKCGCCGCE